MADEPTTTNLEIDYNKWYDAELDGYVENVAKAWVFVTLPDETEERFRISERLLHRAGYFNTTPKGTKLSIKLGKFEHGLQVVMVKQAPPSGIPPRPDARNLPWRNAKYLRPTKPELDHIFLTVTDPNEFFRVPTEVYVSKRLLERAGYPNGLAQDQEITVRMIQGERGLMIVQVKYAADAKSPSHQIDD